MPLAELRRYMFPEQVHLLQSGLRRFTRFCADKPDTFVVATLTSECVRLSRVNLDVEPRSAKCAVRSGPPLGGVKEQLAWAGSTPWWLRVRLG